MSHTMKLIMKYVFYGISLGCTFFVVTCLVLFLGREKELLEPIFSDFGRQSIGAMIIGLACGTTSVIYQFQRPSGWLKILIHFCVGMGVFYPIAIHLGWIPFHPEQIMITILRFICSCAIFMIIWFCFYQFNRKEAKIINQRLKELNQDHHADKG